MIDKATAFTIAGNDYRLCDKYGKEWKIYGIENDYFSVTNPSEHLAKWVSFDEIGKHFFILAHPMENLTKEINGVVLIVELARLSCNVETIYYEPPSIIEEYGMNKEVYVNLLSDSADKVIWCLTYNFHHNSFMTDPYCHYTGKCNQLELFNYLNKNHFSHLLPEGSWLPIKL